ncbi:MAG: hypothetical protein ABL977_09935 [Candidatus Eisenbacteria bacterium]
MTLFSFPRRTALVTALLVASAALFVTGCSKDRANPLAPGADAQVHEELFSLLNPHVRATSEVQLRHTPNLMALRGVVGTATGIDANGRVGIMVLTEEPLGAGRLPAMLDGVPVFEEVTGKIKAMAVADHRVKQTPPVQMGTSGGWRFDLANGFCCGGTLGSLVSKGGAQYVLSNYHVLEADIVAGGNSRVATAGDAVVQPALIDVSCNAATAQNVATLSGIKSLPGSNVDAAIAQVVSGQVRTDGAILEIGTISSATVAASLNKAVKKSGRTTGLTRSKISGLNATISVAYENECAGGAAFTKTFTGQIVISNRGSRFLNSGDSGSLMVEDVTTGARAIGLLFAGGSSTAIANPIGQVLSFLGATMVGN